MAEQATARYMPDKVSLVGIAAGAVLIVAAIAVGIAAAFVVLHAGRDGEAPPRLAAHYGSPPPIAGPVTLQPAPAGDIATLRSEKRRILSTYAWIDRSRGIARVPIDRAMTLLARRAQAEATAQ
jgi:hypothetical protein